MKKLAMIILMAICVIIGVKTVDARVYSSIIRGSDVYSGQRTTTSTISLTTNEYSSVTGSITHIKPRALGTLEMGSTSGSRTIEFTIYEDDEYPNGDDIVRGYEFKISGRKMVSGTVSDTLYDSGNIDSTGDNTVELYLESYLPAKNGDTSVNNGNMINFQCYLGPKLSSSEFWNNCA